MQEPPGVPDSSWSTGVGVGFSGPSGPGIGWGTSTTYYAQPSATFTIATVVPEPATVTLLGSALLVIGGMGLVRRRA